MPQLSGVQSNLEKQAALLRAHNSVLIGKRKRRRSSPGKLA